MTTNQTDKTRHTPGPWKAEQAIGTWKGHRVYGGLDTRERFDAMSGRKMRPEPLLIARVDYREDYDSEANARLIAAAPDLLEAAKLALFFANKKGQSELVLRLRAAIAKAESR